MSDYSGRKTVVGCWWLVVGGWLLVVGRGGLESLVEGTWRVKDSVALCRAARQQPTTNSGFYISITSFSLAVHISSIFLISASVSFWISSVERLDSSSVIFLSLRDFLMASLPSRRMLRIAVRCSSRTLCRCFTISRRRSSVKGGIGTRMILPS